MLMLLRGAWILLLLSGLGSAGERFELHWSLDQMRAQKSIEGKWKAHSSWMHPHRSGTMMVVDHPDLLGHFGVWEKSADEWDFYIYEWLPWRGPVEPIQKGQWSIPAQGELIDAGVEDWYGAGNFTIWAICRLPDDSLHLQILGVEDPQRHQLKVLNNLHLVGVPTHEVEGATVHQSIPLDLELTSKGESLRYAKGRWQSLPLRGGQNRAHSILEIKKNNQSFLIHSFQRNWVKDALSVQVRLEVDEMLKRGGTELKVLLYQGDETFSKPIRRSTRSRQGGKSKVEILLEGLDVEAQLEVRVQVHDDQDRCLDQVHFNTHDLSYAAVGMPDALRRQHETRLRELLEAQGWSRSLVGDGNWGRESFSRWTPDFTEWLKASGPVTGLGAKESFSPFPSMDTSDEKWRLPLDALLACWEEGVVAKKTFDDRFRQWKGMVKVSFLGHGVPELHLLKGGRVERFPLKRMEKRIWSIPGEEVGPKELLGEGWALEARRGTEVELSALQGRSGQELPLAMVQAVLENRDLELEERPREPWKGKVQSLALARWGIALKAQGKWHGMGWKGEALGPLTRGPSKLWKGAGRATPDLKVGLEMDASSARFRTWSLGPSQGRWARLMDEPVGVTEKILDGALFMSEGRAKVLLLVGGELQLWDGGHLLDRWSRKGARLASIAWSPSGAGVVVDRKRDGQSWLYDAHVKKGKLNLIPHLAPLSLGEGANGSGAALSMDGKELWLSRNDAMGAMRFQKSAEGWVQVEERKVELASNSDLVVRGHRLWGINTEGEPIELKP